VSNVVNATAIGTTSGNPDLHSEVAFSKTFGVVLRPRWVPKLNLSVDYIDIALNDAIPSLTLVDNLDACYDSSNRGIVVAHQLDCRHESDAGFRGSLHRRQRVQQATHVPRPLRHGRQLRGFNDDVLFGHHWTLVAVIG
jgi:TonB dependent receptor